MKDIFASARDNTPKAHKEVRHLEKMRRSLIETVQRCPANAYADILGLGTRKVSRAAIAGAIMHRFLEAFLRGLFDLEEADVFQMAVKEGLTEEEARALWQYMKTLLSLLSSVKVVEHEYGLGIVPGAPLFSGTFDAVFALPDNGVLCVDHKSDRTFQPESVWKERFQPMAYTMAASLLWPEAKYIEFEIGYINLGIKVRWRPNLKHCQSEVARIFNEVWAEIKVYERTKCWPEKLNEYCGWCPVKDNCNTLKFAHDNFMASLIQIEDKPLVERYLHAQNVLKSIEAKRNELRLELINDIQSLGGKMEYEGMLLYLYNGKRREIEYSAFAGAVADTIKSSPGIADKLHDRYYELLDSALTVKMGMVDALVTEFPALKSTVDAAITTSEYDSPTLRVTVKDKK